MRHTQASDDTDLMAALYSKNLARVEEEIKKAKDAGTLNEYRLGQNFIYTNPIWYALENYPPALWPLIQAGADVNAQDYELKQTPLFKTNKPALMQMLIKAGADVNIQDHHKQTPLHVARSRQAINVLIKAGGLLDAVDERGNIPLVEAVAANRIGIVKLILTQQPDLIHTKNYVKETPLHFANTREMAQLLLDAGADPKETDYQMSTPLHFIYRKKHRNKGVIKALAPKSTLESYDKWGFTPLHYAAENAKEKWRHAQALIDAGAKVSAKVKDDKFPVFCRTGNTPLHIAALTGSIGIAKLLLKYTRPSKPCEPTEPLAPKKTWESWV